MLQREFENLTDIFPDVLTYEAAEREYMNGGWASKAEFCTAYKFNEDGLAQKIQTAANARYFELESRQPEALDLTDLEATMLQSLRDMLHDEWERDAVGTALIGYDYLLRRLEVATI